MAFAVPELQVVSNGAAATPSFHFNSSLTTGFYVPTTGELCLSASGVGTLTIKASSAGAVLEVGVLQVPNGTNSLPSLTFGTDPNTGVYRAGADQVGITAGASQVMHFDSVGVSLATGFMDAPVGSASAPTYTFTGDVNTGMYASAGDNLEFTTGGTRRLLLDSTGAKFASAATLDTDGSSLTLQANGGVGVLLSGDPTIALGVATKQYVDAVATGLDLKDSVRGATTAVLTATRSGDVITETGFGAFAVDGLTWVALDRVLVKDDITAGDQISNGIYEVTTVGDGSTSFVLTRTTDANTDAEVNAGMFTFVEEGTANADIGYVLTTNNPITLNTTALAFAQFTSQGGNVAGPGSSTVDAFVRWNNTTGTLIQDSSAITMDDAGELTFTEGTTALRGIVYPDSLADAFHFKDASATLMTFNSSSDQVLFPTGVMSLSNGSTATNSILLVDNLSDSLSMEISGGTKLITFITSNSAEAVAIGAAATFAAGITYASATISASTTLDASNYLVRCDTSGGSVTLTLPAKASHDGRQYKIYKSSGLNSMIIDPNSAETIDGGSASLTFTNIHDHITLICNATDGWFTM